MKKPLGFTLVELLACQPKPWSPLAPPKAGKPWRRQAQRAFTLVELLVTISIIAILAALLLPALRTSRQRASLAVCAGNLRQIHLSLEMYANDNDENYPEARVVGAWGVTNANWVGWMERIYPYLHDTKTMACPGQPPPIQNSYSYFLGCRSVYLSTGAAGSLNRKQLLLPSQYILAGDNAYNFNPLTDDDKDNYSKDCLFDAAFQQYRRQYHNEKLNVLFADGHVRPYSQFLPGDMTFAPDLPGVPW